MPERKMATEIPRRTLLAAPLLALGAAAPDWLGALRTRAAALNGPGLLRSYDDVGGRTAFDLAHANTAYVYDNAVAGLALLMSGEVALARRLGDALVAAQNSDRFFHDGRVRNAYASGPSSSSGFYPMPGWWNAARGTWVEDAYQVGSATGVVAWAMLLWLGLYRACAAAVYRTAADRAADWVLGTTAAARGFSGGFFGFEPAQRKDVWVSTEHNIDLAVAFAALGRRGPVAHARAFVASMWNRPEQRFFTGLRPNGTPNDHSAVDANLWPLLAPGAETAWAPALDWILARHGLPQGAPAGVDFNADRDGIWLEGTAMTALALRQAGRGGLADSFLATLRAQTAESGLIYACTTQSLTTGLSTGINPGVNDFFYYRKPHIAPTGWAVLASADKNPF
jgi:hypothetical protein